jgi:hypothetical protein
VPPLRHLQHHGDAAGARAIAPAVLPQLAKLYATKQVELRADAEAGHPAAAGYPHLAATEEDWSTEYLAAILSVKVVADMDEAMEHINTYSSKHTESIITETTRRDALPARSGFGLGDGQRLDAFADGLNMAWARKSASRTTSCTHAARSDWKA